MPEERFGFMAISNGQEDFNVAVSNLFLGYTAEQARPLPDDLPSAASVEGSFRLAQSLIESNFLAPFIS